MLQTQLFTIWVCLIIKMLQVEPEAEDSYPIFWGVVKQKLGVCIIYIYTPQSNIADADMCAVLHHISVVLYMRSGSGKPKTAWSWDPKFVSQEKLAQDHKI